MTFTSPGYMRPGHDSNHHNNNSNKDSMPITLPPPNALVNPNGMQRPPPPPPPPPPPIAQYPRDDQLHQRPQVDLGDALSYFDLVKTHYADYPDVYVKFLDSLTDFHKSRAGHVPGLIADIAKLFADSRELLEHLNDFLPPGYFVERGDPDTNVVRLTIPGHGRQARRPAQWPERSPGATWHSQVAANRWRNGDGLPWTPPGDADFDTRSLPTSAPNEDIKGLEVLIDLAMRPSIASAAREALRAKLNSDAQAAGNQTLQQQQQQHHPNAWSMANPSAALNDLHHPHHAVKSEAEAMEIYERQHQSGNYYAAHHHHDPYMQMRNNSTTSGTTNSEMDKSSEPQSPSFPRPPRPRPTSTHSLTSPRLQTKVTKRLARKRSLSGASKTGPGKPSAYVQQNSSRAFTCPFQIYGCTSTFGSKNEWKRHINTAHMRLGFWRCDISPCDMSERKPNDFNRKDLFIQHVRRMHSGEKDAHPHAPPLSKSAAAKDPEEQALNAAAARCYRHIRSTPEQSGCLFCEAKFLGEGSWDERLEHVGRHMENAKKENDEVVGPEHWLKDRAMEEWLAREGLIVKNPDGEGWTLHEGASVN